MASSGLATLRSLSGSVALPFALGLCCLAAQPAAAQYYNTVGRADPSVIVDTSVLDQLGPPPNIGTVPPPDGLGKTPVNGARRYGYGGPSGAVPPSATPKSRLLTVPAMPGKPVPKLSGGSTGGSSAAPAPAAAPKMASTPAPQPAPQAAPKPAPKVAAITPPPAPPPAPAAAAAPSVPTQITPPSPAPPIPVAVTPPPAPAPASVVAVPPPPPAPPLPTAASTTVPTVTPVAMPAPAPTSQGAPQVAALPPATTTGAGRLAFDAGSAILNDTARQSLDALAAQMAGNEQRLKVVAYAAGQTNNVSQARRLSLSRALAVRAYLIDKGIRSTRIDVQAMGAPENGNGPADRVDLSLVAQ